LVLGADHPLTRVGGALQIAAGQGRVTAAMLVGSLIAAARGDRWAPAVAIAAAIVLLGLAIVAAVLVGQRRERATDLILAGREDLPIADVQRQSRRLLAPRTRLVLARTLERTLDEAPHRSHVPVFTARPSVDAEVVEDAAAELREVVRLLRTDRAVPRAVALAERVVTDGDSPLYAHDAAALREALRRISSLLERVEPLSR
jgi:hypothetical protein